ncbi:MAG: hypothetical protein HKN05_20390 [Rhizobiales bacterium]|nr:hypothetical protein [Hyphomicrobiales bacterium]
MVAHAITFQGSVLADLGTGSSRPAVLKFTEQDFIPVLLSDLEDQSGQTRLRERDATKKQNSLSQARFFQPVHRTFNVVMLEAFCDTPGKPRLDPERVVAAGICIRRTGQVSGPRRNPNYDPHPIEQGWFRTSGQVLGWRPVPPQAAGQAPIWDPEPEARKAQRLGRNPHIKSQFEAALPASSTWQEDWAPLFIAPPELCRKQGKTYFYGYLPVTSEERSDVDPSAPAPFADEDILARLPALLRRTRTDEDVEPVTGTKTQKYIEDNAGDPDVAQLLSTLRYLAQEPGIFPPFGEPEPDDAASTLRNLLRGTNLETDAGNRSLFDVLDAAYRTLIERRNADAVVLPGDWPLPTQSGEDAYIAAAGEAMRGRWSGLAPDEKRYDLLNARYRLHAFVRIAGEPGCPDKTIWSEPSDIFEIVPWYEGSDAKPTVVELPPLNPDRMGDMKPNVAFKVPPEIQKFMSALKLDDLMDGKQPSTRLGFGMICGFSIPILTICAFIVLQIFLALLHILFWWLPFVRICIPFPMIQEEE